MVRQQGLLGVIVVACMAWLPMAAEARETCTVGGDTWMCDVECDTVTGCSVPGSHGACDDLPGLCVGGTNDGAECGEASDCSGGTCTPNGDGKCTICGTSIGDTIDGTGGDDVVCAGDGDDIVNSKGGDDIVAGEDGDDTISAGNGADFVVGGAGSNVVRGGGNDDILLGGTDDDRLLGEGGSDLVVGCGGRDLLSGGGGDDNVWTVLYLVCGVSDDDVGTLICGDDGDDSLIGWGPAHQCMDGGDGTDTCTYNFGISSRTATSLDLGTGKGCESFSGLSAGTYTESCGCAGDY